MSATRALVAAGAVLCAAMVCWPRPSACTPAVGRVCMGCNFAGADLRGANFTNAIYIGNNFAGANL